jgi:hypothetical protein
MDDGPAGSKYKQPYMVIIIFVIPTVVSASMVSLLG